jgi:hypothetical protein
VVLVAGAIWVTVGASPATAAPSLTVSPNTGLTDQQSVTVSGAGWAANAQIGICEAVPVAPAGAADCDGGSAEVTPANGTGDFTLGFPIERIVSVPAAGGRVDCADPATPCVLAAADVSNVAGTFETVPLGFAPLGPTIVTPGVGRVLEGNAGTTTVDVPVTLNHRTFAGISAPWRTVFVPGAPGNQADPATDYVPASGIVTIPPSGNAGTVEITVNGDTVVEPDEYIVVQFGEPDNGEIGGYFGLGFALIRNDDHSSVVAGVGSVAEGDSGTTNLHIPVTLDKPSYQTITAQWETVVVPGAPGNQADPATDYTPASGTVTFAPGATTAFASISVNGDTEVEPDEYIVVVFGDPVNATMGRFINLGFGAIDNDDG